MPFPADINFDGLIFQTLAEMNWAIKEWMNGRPRSEEAFMNQVTSKLARERRGCDVGVTTPVTMTARLGLLHRQGKNQTDKYGADLAITIVVNQTYLKTALFQFKKSDNYRAELERSQLRDALINSEIGDRSFVLTIDEARSGVRIASVSELNGQFDDTQKDGAQKTKTFDCSGWTCLSQWIWNWFSCDIGPESDVNQPNNVESLLERYVADRDWEAPWSLGMDDFDLPQTYQPAKAWLLLFFEKNTKGNAQHGK